MTNLRKSALTVAIASSLALVGCGGGGGSSSGGGGGGGGSQQTSVSGSAIKGPLQHAEVRVIEVDDAGAEIRTVAQTQTDDNGYYTVNLSSDYEGGLLKIVVRADDDTTMICDAPKGCGDVGFRDRIEQGLEGLELKAYSEKEDGTDAVETSVSTWSTLAAERADELVTAAGNLRNASQIANSDVSGLVGFDIARTWARSLTEDGELSADEAVSAVLNAAAAELVFGDGGTGSLAEKLETLTSAIKEDMKQGSETDGAESPVVRLVQAAREVADSGEGQLDDEARNAVSNLDDDYEAATDEDLIVAPGASQDEKIAKFKDFVTDTRSWVQSIEDLNSDELTAAIDLDVTAAENALRGIQEGQLQFVVSAVNAAFNELAQNPELVTAGGELDYELVDDAGVTVASGTLTVADQDGLSMSIDGSVTNGAATSVPFSLDIDTTIAPDLVDVSAGTLKRLAASTGIVVSGEVGDANSGSLTLNSVALGLQLAAAVEATTTGEIEDEALFAQFQSASVSGDIEAVGQEGDRFSGLVRAEIVRLEKAGQLAPGTTMEPFSLKSADVDGAFQSASGNTFSADLRFNLNNAATFDLLAWSEYSGNDDVHLSFPVRFDDLSPIAGDLVDEQTLRTEIGVWPVYQDYFGETPDSYDLSVSNYGPTNDTHFLTRYLPADEAADAVSEIRGYLANSFVTETVELVFTDPDTGEDEVITRKISELLTGDMWINGPDWASGSDGAMIGTLGPNEKAIGVRVYLQDAQIPDGVVAVLNPNTELLSGLRVEGFVDQVGGQQRFRFFIIRNTDIRPNSLTADRITELYPEQGGSLIYFEFGDSNGGKGYVSYEITSTAENYEACTQNRTAFVGDDYGYGCYDLLGWVSGDYMPLDGGQLEQVLTLRDRALVQRFGEDLVSRLVIDEFWINSERLAGATSGRMEVSATFPELESDEKFADFSVSLSANIDLQELPAAKATVTVNRNSYLGGDLLANVRWDGGNYSVAMQTDDIEDPNSYTGRIFNTQGYELTVAVTVDDLGEITSVSGDALLNGEDIGDLELRDNGMIFLVFPNGDGNEIMSLL